MILHQILGKYLITICDAHIKFQFVEQNKQTPTDLKSVGVNLCLLRCIYTFADSRGRLSLQGEIKLPYEKYAFRGGFFIL